MENYNIERMTVSGLPKYSPGKADLPKRTDYISAASWLRAVRDQIDEPVIFALDNALMCQGTFLGHTDEFYIWVYGSDRLTRFNGIVVIGNDVPEQCTVDRNGLRYTDFNRTLIDFLANEPILDMQGITEALSDYYYSNGESFSGIAVPPEYQELFETIAEDAVEYYDL